AAAAVGATILIAIPLAMTISVRKSQADVRGGNLSAALNDARAAEAVEPYAASPRIQEALVREVQGNLADAAAAARQATDAEKTNWRPWIILSRIEAERGSARGALRAYRRARSLDPRSP